MAGLGGIAFTAALEGEQWHELSDKEKSSALYGLGVVKNLQGKYEEGTDLLKRALVIDERLYGFDGFYVGYTVGELAISYYKQNKIEEGLALMPQATAIYQKHSEKYSPQALSATRTLFSKYANELHKLGRELEAKQLENLADSIMFVDPEELLLWDPQ